MERDFQTYFTELWNKYLLATVNLVSPSFVSFQNINIWFEYNKSRIPSYTGTSTDRTEPNCHCVESRIEPMLIYLKELILLYG